MILGLVSLVTVLAFSFLGMGMNTLAVDLVPDSDFDSMPEDPPVSDLKMCGNGNVSSSMSLLEGNELVLDFILDDGLRVGNVLLEKGAKPISVISTDPSIHCDADEYGRYYVSSEFLEQGKGDIFLKFICTYPIEGMPVPQTDVVWNLDVHVLGSLVTVSW